MTERRASGHARGSSAGLQPYLAGTQGRLVDVTLPRFKLSWNRELSPALQALGMRAAFTSSADFSGMATERLRVALVQHEAAIDVNEEGTVAVAATAVLPVPVSMEMAETFRADHPFVFALRDGKSGLVLFMGRFATPG